MADQITYIPVRAPALRVLLLVPAVLAAAGAWYGLRWCVANTMADYAPDLETAQAAVRLAPEDPLAHLKLARQNRKSFLPEEMPEALRQYEQAAALSPNDYLVWMELGRARGAAGDTEGAVRALGRAAQLAPHYADPRWHLGNQLLRAGRVDEAFAELRLAGDADPGKYRPPVFDLAWQVYGQDLGRVTGAIGNTPSARAQLATVLLGRGRLDDALAVWAGLGAAEREGQAAAGEALARALYDAKRYRALFDLLRETQPDLAAGRVENGGFEAEIAPAGKRYFGWQVTPVAQAQIAFDPRTRRGGARSLRVVFAAPSDLDFHHVWQLVVVEPGARYRLSFYVRAEDLKSASAPVVQVLDAANPSAALASGPPAAPGTSDWQQVGVDFTTPARAEAVLVRVVRAGCPADACPIYGKVWYDDFDLQRAGR